MKNVLVLDDEIDLAEAVATSLRDNGYSAQFCGSVDEAMEHFSKNKFDLIISDVKMPKKTGLEFYNSIKKDLKAQSTAFVLMTGYSEGISIQSAYDMGVDEFVSKPFDLEDLNLVVNLILKSDVQDYAEGEKFYKIPLTEFLLASVSDYNVYLKIGENYLCLAKKGQELLPERLQNYYKKGMQHIYLASLDFAKYVGMQVNLSEAVKTKPLEKLKKIKLFNHFCKTISESGLNQYMSDELYAKVFGSFENYSQITFENGDLFQLIQSLGNSHKDRSSKSVMVAFLAMAVFQTWKWNHPKHLSKIVMAALLCDVGLEEGAATHKPVTELTPEERRVYEKHPLQGYMQLSKIKNISEEVLYVVLQHHENDSGLGFPQKLAKSKTHPYSRVIHALFEFVEQVPNMQDANSIKTCLDNMLAFQKKLISVQVLKTLYIIFALEIPTELESVLLPTDTARVI